MKLLKQLKDDKLIAFKARKQEEKDLLGLVISEVTKIEKEPTDDNVQRGIKKMIDNAKLCDDSYPEDVLSKYLSAMLNETEIEVVIENIITDLGDTANIGTVMGQLKARSDIDKKIAATLVRNLLN